MKNTPRSILMILALIFCLSLPAQDIHFSQYYNAPLYTNPALTGIYKGDMRFMGNYRNQWTRVPVDYRSYSAAFDMKYFHKKMRKGFFGGGLIIISDEAGDSELGMTQLGLNVAYSQLLNEYNILSGGFQVGLGQRAFKTDNLTFGNQWNGDVFSATESSRENFSSTSFGYLDLGAGLNWHLQPEEGLRHLDIGLAAFHLNRPQQKFYEADDVPLPMRWSIYLSGEMEVNELWSIVFHSLGQKQGTYREGIAGVAAKYWLNKNTGKEMA
ncbi:MAG TPA: type IX secretion system membrane protein PorP/SprF, partial [Phaeodactylibacter sp.]|nr:type IX secretion system membrane protein PorP/SprF [Phaeodactylibacter sp.]